MYSAPTCGLSVPRQNGKNALLEMRELYGLCVIGERILHTAHEVKTARKAFLRLNGFFENEREYPELAAMVKCIRKANGQEAIELINGGAIEFSARSRGAARGFTVDVVVFDEAQELTDEQIEAMLPTMAAAPLGNRQFIYTGTPPGPKCPGTVFGRTRKNIIAGNEDGACWHEWSVEEVGDVYDRKRWYETNPAMGLRISEDFTGKELVSMSPDGFARERLGWWASTSSLRLIPKEEWKALIAPCPPYDGKIGMGVKFSPDGSRASLAACIRPDLGNPCIDLINTFSMTGSTDAIEEIIMRHKSEVALVAIDGKAYSDSLYANLKDSRFPVKGLNIVSTGDAVAANVRFLDAIKGEHIEHLDQPILNRSVAVAVKRKIGDKGGWGFDAVGEEDVTPIEACALAYWAAMTAKRTPGRRARML